MQFHEKSVFAIHGPVPVPTGTGPYRTSMEFLPNSSSGLCQTFYICFIYVLDTENAWHIYILYTFYIQSFSFKAITERFYWKYFVSDSGQQEKSKSTRETRSRPGSEPGRERVPFLDLDVFCFRDFSRDGSAPVQSFSVKAITGRFCWEYPLLSSKEMTRKIKNRSYIHLYVSLCKFYVWT